MMLTQKQQAFCQAYIETGNASEAYRRAYNTAKMQVTTIHRKAKEVIDNGSVSARIAELQAEHQQRHNSIVDDLVKELEEARQIAIEAKHASAAVSATLGKAKLLGYATLFSAEIAKHKAFLRAVLERKQAREISAIEAAQLLEAEGVRVPETLMLEIKQSKCLVINDDIYPSVINVIGAEMTPEEAEEAEDAYLKILG